MTDQIAHQERDLEDAVKHHQSSLKQSYARKNHFKDGFLVMQLKRHVRCLKQEMVQQAATIAQLKQNV